MIVVDLVCIHPAFDNICWNPQ